MPTAIVEVLFGGEREGGRKRERERERKGSSTIKMMEMEEKDDQQDSIMASIMSWCASCVVSRTVSYFGRRSRGAVLLQQEPKVTLTTVLPIWP